MATADFSMVSEVVSGGAKNVKFGFAKPKGTAGTGAFLNGVSNLVSALDLGGTRSVVWGGLDGAGTNDWAENTGGTPITGGTLPIVVFGWCLPDSFPGSMAVWCSSNGGAQGFAVSATNTGLLRAQSFGTGSGDAITTGALTANRWHRYIAVFESTTSRSIYTDTDLTGGTNTTSSSVSGPDRIRFLAWTDGSTDWFGNVGEHHVFIGGAVPTSAQRAAFLTDCQDPETIMGTRANSMWFSGSSPTTDQRGTYDLTISGTVTTLTSVLCVRDYVLGTNAVRAVGLTPTWSSSVFNGQGGGTFASSQYLRSNTTPITASPIQVFAVGNSTSATAAQVAVFIGRSSATTHYYVLEFRGDVASDPIYWRANDGSSNQASDIGFTSGQNHLLYGRETSATDRGVAIDGSAEGTDTTSRTPTSLTRFALGILDGSSQSSPLTGSLGFILVFNSTETTWNRALEKFIEAVFDITAIP